MVYFVRSESIKQFQLEVRMYENETKIHQNSIYCSAEQKGVPWSTHYFADGSPGPRPASVYLFLSQKQFPCFSATHCYSSLDRFIVIISRLSINAADCDNHSIPFTNRES